MVRVLVIEDEAAILENILELLSFAGHDGIGATSGQEGIRMAHEQQPDLVITDILMPDIDGYAVARELSSNENTRHIPFIFMSAHNDQESRKRGIDLGAKGYLVKPFSDLELFDIVEQSILG